MHALGRPEGVPGPRPPRARAVRCHREVWRQRQFLEAHELRALTGRSAHGIGERGFMDGGIVVPGKLHRCDAKRCA